MYFGSTPWTRRHAAATSSGAQAVHDAGRRLSPAHRRVEQAGFSDDARWVVPAAPAALDARRRWALHVMDEATEAARCCRERFRPPADVREGEERYARRYRVSTRSTSRPLADRDLAAAGESLGTRR